MNPGSSVITTLKRLHKYWSEKKENRSFPARKDLDPIDFHYALGDVSLIDVEQGNAYEKPLYRVRLLGSNIQTRIGSAFTNRDLDEFPEQDSLYRMRVAYREVLKTKEPLAYPSFFKVIEEYHPFICCIWPLSSDGEVIDMFLCCRERLYNKNLIPDRQILEKQYPTWPYQNWATNKLLTHITH